MSTARILALQAIAISILAGCTVVPSDTTKQHESTGAQQAPVQPRPSHPVDYDLEPQLLRMSDPVYPDSARKAGQEGTVLCEVRISTLGAVTQVELLHSAAPALDRAAMSVARTAVFKPALKRDRPVECWAVIPIEFKLH